jgi:uncharacterized HAD superfamily protein
MKKINLSNLNQTWFIDIDGVILKHNGYMQNGDELNNNVVSFFRKIPKHDYIILITSRKKIYKDITEKFLKNKKIRFNHIIYDLPVGERIIINDKKPRGLKTAIAINIKRDNFPDIKTIKNSTL